MNKSSDIVLEVKDLGVSFEDQEAIGKIDLSVARGEFIAILGPSGCGKSTLLNVLSGLLPPTRGTVSVEGRRMYGPESEAPHVGYVFQEHRLLPWRSVKKNLELVLAASSVSRQLWDDKINDILEILHISRYKDSWPLRLSGGERQRVSIARALLVEPSYVMMDEPFSTLDELTARTLRQELIDIWQRTGATIVFVTHSIREATFLADRIIILTRGPANVDDNYSVPIDRPRDYEDPRIGQVEAEIVKRVLGVWELEKT